MITKLHIRNLTGTALITLAASLHFTAAHAQTSGSPPPKDFQASLGLGAVYFPDYEGSDNYRALPFPYISLNYKDIVFLKGTEIGVNALKINLGDNARFKIGPIAKFRMGRNPKDNKKDLRGFGKIKPSIELGGFARLELNSFSANVSIGKDVANGHDGLVGEAEAGFDLPIGTSLFASIKGTASWADKKYMNSFFSVNAAQALASGLPRYQAKAGLKDVGAHIALSYVISEQWTVTGLGGYKKLLNDAADSPLVKTRGSADQFIGGLFLSYTF